MTIKYSTERAEAISNLMSNMDLGISGIGLAPTILEWETKTKVDKKYKDNLKVLFIKEFKNEMIIKHIKIETI